MKSCAILIVALPMTNTVMQHSTGAPAVLAAEPQGVSTILSRFFAKSLEAAAFSRICSAVDAVILRALSAATISGMTWRLLSKRPRTVARRKSASTNSKRADIAVVREPRRAHARGHALRVAAGVR